MSETEYHKGRLKQIEIDNIDEFFEKKFREENPK